MTMIRIIDDWRWGDIGLYLLGLSWYYLSDLRGFLPRLLFFMLVLFNRALWLVVSL